MALLQISCGTRRASNNVDAFVVQNVRDPSDRSNRSDEESVPHDQPEFMCFSKTSGRRNEDGEDPLYQGSHRSSDRIEREEEENNRETGMRPGL
jgi:hypothetical protein